MRRLCVLLTLVLVGHVFFAPASKALGVSAQCAVLLDVQSGRFLYEKDAQSPMLIASTTKMMTALVVLKHCNLDAVVTVKKEQVGVEGSSMYLKEGEQLTVRELLYGLLLASGNDAAETLAVYCAGSIPQFADKMNELARQLNLTRTHFSNPHGLNANEHYSSARDLALIAMEAMKSADFKQIVSTKTISLAGRTLTNHNKLLWNYPGTIGVKTGYTIKAGRCLVSAADRDGRVLIAVTLKAPDDWKDHAALYDAGFAQFRTRVLCAQDDIVCTIPVVSGLARSVPVRVRETLSMPLSEDELRRVKTSFQVPWFAWAPVKKDDEAGKIRYTLDGKLLCEALLYYDGAVEEYVPPQKSFWQSLSDFGTRLRGKSALGSP